MYFREPSAGDLHVTSFTTGIPADAPDRGGFDLGARIISRVPDWMDVPLNPAVHKRTLSSVPITLSLGSIHGHDLQRLTFLSWRNIRANKLRTGITVVIIALVFSP